MQVRQTIPNVSENIEKWEPLSDADGNVNGHFENGLAVYQNVKHKTTVQPSNSTLRYLFKRNETHVHIMTCIEIFTATLFRRA